MIYHVLPGDAQVDAFKQAGIDGEMLVCRECLVDGDLSGDSLDEFFINRAAFTNDASGEDPSIYNANVASQFRKLTELGVGDEANLWFEYELFCAANLWFCLDLLAPTGAEVYRVEPVYLTAVDRWDGFGGATGEDMRRCFGSRIKLTDRDLRLGSELWKAFKSADKTALHRLSGEISPAFPYLNEVCEAGIEKDFRPRQFIQELLTEGRNGIDQIFPEFRRRAGVYGFGDVQVQRIIDAIS